MTARSLLTGCAGFLREGDAYRQGTRLLTPADVARAVAAEAWAAVDAHGHVLAGPSRSLIARHGHPVAGAEMARRLAP